MCTHNYWVIESNPKPLIEEWIESDLFYRVEGKPLLSNEQCGHLLVRYCAHD